MNEHGIDRPGVTAEPISFTSRSGIWLDGLLYQSAQAADTVIIHVHGSYGNFYSNRWLRQMAAVYTVSGMDFLPFNLSTHDGLAESYTYTGEGQKPLFGYGGHAIRPFKTCLEDIGGAIDFAKNYYSKIVLQGHSQGCDRIVAFGRTQRDACPMIMLSPADTRELYRRYAAGTAEIVTSIDGLPASPFAPPFDWLPIQAYGVDEPPREVYQIPICRSALESLIRDSDGVLLDIANGDAFHLSTSAFVALGGADGFQVLSNETVFSYFENRFDAVKRCYIPDEGHELDGHVRGISQQIVAWLRENGLAQ